MISRSESSVRGASPGIEPFRTPRLGPAEGRMVAALLGEERRAPSRFFLPTSLNELGMNLGEASLKRKPLGSGQGGGSRFGDRSARCSRAQSPFLCVLLMWSALSRTGHRVLTRDTVYRTPPPLGPFRCFGLRCAKPPFRGGVITCRCYRRFPAKPSKFLQLTGGST